MKGSLIMKKIISLVAFLIFCLSGFVANAEEEVMYAELEEAKFPETYVDNSISLFSFEKTLEETLIEGWSNLDERISVAEYNITVEEFGDVYRSIVYNNPKMYYVSNGCGIGYNTKTKIVVSVYPEYFETDKAVINQTMAEIDAATEEIMLCLDESMTDFEKIMAVHDYMILHYEYDYTYSNYDITIMTTKKGVCQAYAFAFKHMMDELGIECLYVASSEKMKHGWNLVKLGNEWYHIDLTWDDPGTNYGQVRHDYALLSDYEIQHLENPHYGYDLKGLEASSDRYDKEHWHDGVGAVSTIDGRYYYVDGNDLINQDGEIIFKDLAGADGRWGFGGGLVLTGANYTGIADYNGLLYFNTDEAIYSYNPTSKKIVKVLEYEGICGLFIDKNTLKYCKANIVFDSENRGIIENFIEAGQLKLGKIRFGGTFHKDNKIIKRICKESDSEDIYVFAKCDDCVKVERITKSDVSKISFDFKECQTLYFWNDQLKPLKEKEIYKK